MSVERPNYVCVQMLKQKSPLDSPAHELNLSIHAHPYSHNCEIYADTCV